MRIGDTVTIGNITGLGDSSLNFDVRVYVKDMNDWLPVMHEFHMAVVNALS